MAPIEVYIGGVKLSQVIICPSLTISYNLSQRSQMTVRVDSSDNTWSPQAGSEIKIYYKGVLIYGGLIWSFTRNKISGQNYRKNEITAVGYEWLFDRRSTGIRSYTDQFATDILLDILSNCINGGDGADGVGNSLVTPASGPVIGSITLEDVTVAEAFNKVCDVTGLRWYIDQDRELRVFNPADPQGGGAIYQNHGALPNTNNTFVDSLEITETLEQFANRIVVTFKEQPVHVIESFDGSHPSQPTDGTRTKWTLSSPVSQGSIGVDVDGVTQQISVAGGPTAADWYYSPGGVDVEQASTGTPLTSGQKVTFNYWKLDDITVVAANEADIAARALAETTAGIHERRLENTVSGWNLQVLANAMLDQMDKPSRVYSWNAQLSNWNTLRPGQEILMRIGGDLSESAIVRSVNINEVDYDHLEVSISAVSGHLLKDGFQTFASMGGGSSSYSGGGPTIISVSTKEDITKFMLPGDDPDDWGIPFNRAIEESKLTGGKDYLVPERAQFYDFKTHVVQPDDARNVNFFGAGEASRLRRIADMPDGHGWFNTHGYGMGLFRLFFEGNVTVPVQLNYSAFGGNPMHILLTKNSTFWQHDGSAEFYLEECVVEHTGGYASVANAKTLGIANLHFRGNKFRYNRPHLFGLDDLDLEYGSWTGGIFVRGDCSGANLGRIVGFFVQNSKFYRGAGNQVWQHCLAFDSHHERFRVQDCEFDTIARDAVLIGNCDGATVSNNDMRRIGYVTKTDNDTPDPQALMGHWAVAIDTSGYAEDVTITDNKMYSVYGGMIDGDGFRKGIIKGNIFDGTWEGVPEIPLKMGVNLGDTSANGACEKIQIVNNQFRGSLQAALRLNHAKNCVVAGNLVDHPDTATEAPIQLWSDANRCDGNKIDSNWIWWNGSNHCIVEVGSFNSTCKNQIFNNFIRGTNYGEFLRHADSQSYAGTSTHRLQADAFIALRSVAFNDADADKYDDTHTLIRRGSDGSVEVSLEVDSGTRVWEALAGLWKKVGTNDAIYYASGPVVVGDDHEDGSGAALQIHGFANSSVGYSTQGTSYDAIQAPDGGAYAKWLIARTSLTMMSDTAANAGVSSANQARLYFDSTLNLLQASQHGGQFYDVLVGDSMLVDGTIPFTVVRGRVTASNLFVFKGGVLGVGTNSPAPGLAAHFVGGVYSSGAFNSGASGIAFKTNNDYWSIDSSGNQSGAGESNFLQGYKVNGVLFARYLAGKVEILTDYAYAEIFNSTATGTNLAIQAGGGNLQMNAAGSVSGAGQSNFVLGYIGGSFRGAGVAVGNNGVGGASMAIYDGSSYLTFAQAISGGVGVSAHVVNGTTLQQGGIPISSLYAAITHNHNSSYYLKSEVYTKSETDGNSFNAFVTHIAAYHQVRTINYKDHAGNNQSMSIYGP